MVTSTITEGLAEIKLIDKRVTKKIEFIGNHLLRLESLKDPLEKDGGSTAAIQRELQSINDLHTNKVAIRRAIQTANAATQITIGAQTMSLADWLVWRREVAPHRKGYLDSMSGGIKNNRAKATKEGRQMVGDGTATGPQDIVVHISETWLAAQVEELETTLGTLDGILSLKNATTTITY